jgi:hypothetical protein
MAHSSVASDSDWETDDSEPRPSATRSSDPYKNTSTRQRQQSRRTVPPSLEMSPLGDSAFDDYIDGLDANDVDSMVREYLRSGNDYLFGDSEDDSDKDPDDSDDSSDADDADDFNEKVDPDDSDNEHEEDDSDPNNEDSSSSSSKETPEETHVASGVSIRDHIQAGATWTGNEARSPPRPIPEKKGSRQPVNPTPSALQARPTPEEQESTASSFPAHISNDVDRKLVQEFQVTLASFATVASNDAKELGLPKPIKRTRQAYVRAIHELRRRADPSFAPSNATRYENLPLAKLIREVREVEMMVIGAPLLPKDLKCQMHICKLVTGEAPSLEAPSEASSSFVEEFDKHIEARKRHDAWKEKESTEPKPDRQVNPDCAPQ